MNDGNAAAATAAATDAAEPTTSAAAASVTEMPQGLPRMGAGSAAARRLALVKAVQASICIWSHYQTESRSLRVTWQIYCRFYTHTDPFLQRYAIHFCGDKEFVSSWGKKPSLAEGVCIFQRVGWAYLFAHEESLWQMCSAYHHLSRLLSRMAQLQQ